MNQLLPFLLSLLLPGLGQFAIKDYWKGLLILIVLIGTWFIFPHIPIYYIYVICQVWSLAEIYHKMQKTEGKRSTLRSLIYSLVISVIIIPSIIYLFFFSAWKSGNFITDELLNEDRTLEEMSQIEEALDKYFRNNNHYPLDYSSFVDSKPIWNSWINDSWGNKYRYSFLDSANYILISSGKDEIFKNEDDLSISSTK